MVISFVYQLALQNKLMILNQNDLTKLIIKRRCRRVKKGEDFHS